MPIILHICPRSAWEHAVAVGAYRGDTLDSQGFIHCSEPRQVVEVANHLFRGRTGLVLLVIAPERVRAPIKHEDGGNGESYPHIYGPLEPAAVERVLPFEPGPDGEFQLPAGLA